MHNRPIHGGSAWQIANGQIEDLKQVVSADVNDAWYPPAPEVIEALKVALSYIQWSPDIWGDELRDYLAGHYKLSPESVFVNAGSSPLLHWIIGTLATPNQSLILVEPTYSEYHYVTERQAATERRYQLSPEDGFNIDVGHILSLVDERTCAVILCNPNNPTGGVLPRMELTRLAQALPEHIALIVDEVYIEYTPECSVLHEVKHYPSLAVIRSFSKGHALAGLRAGFAVLGEALRPRILQKGEIPWRISIMANVGVRYALQYESYMRQRIQETVTLRERLWGEISEVKGCKPLESRTNFFLVDISASKWTATELVARLRLKGVLIKDVSSLFDPLQSAFIRITARSQEENPRIVTAFQEIME